eukprot:gene30507-40535_t
MAAGMMPSALAFGAGGEFRSPMALAVIGGLIFSTVLSLIFVPAMFMMMDDIGQLSWRYGRKLLANTMTKPISPHAIRERAAPWAGLLIAISLCAFAQPTLAADETDAPKGAAVTVLTAAKSCFSATVEVSGILMPREEVSIRPDRPAAVFSRAACGSARTCSTDSAATTVTGKNIGAVRPAPNAARNCRRHNIVTAGDGRHAKTGRHHLVQDRQLLIIRPTSTPLDPRQNLNPAHPTPSLRR